MRKVIVLNTLSVVLMFLLSLSCTDAPDATDAGPLADAALSDHAATTDADAVADAAQQETDASSDDDAAQISCAQCTGPVCLTTISGRVVYEDGSAYQGPAAICVGACRNTQTDAQGYFHYQFNECTDYDPGGEAIVLTLLDSGDAQWTQYAVAYRPSQQDVSDQGSDDFDLDLGTHKYYALSASATAYTAAAGASVDQDDLSFDAPAADLGASDLEIKIRRIDLAQEIPPFVPAGLQLDALYYLSPYFTSSSAGLELHFDAASLGWSAGDTGTLYMLGGFANFHFLECNGSDVGDGDFANCGSASVVNGEIVSSRLPQLGWVGLAKTQ